MAQTIADKFQIFSFLFLKPVYWKNGLIEALSTFRIRCYSGSFFCMLLCVILPLQQTFDITAVNGEFTEGRKLAKAPFFQGVTHLADLPNADISPLPYTSALWSGSEFLLGPSEELSTDKQELLDASLVEAQLQPAAFADNLLQISSVRRHFQLNQNFVKVSIHLTLSISPSEDEVQLSAFADYFYLSFPMYEAIQIGGLKVMQELEQPVHLAFKSISSYDIQSLTENKNTQPAYYVIHLMEPVKRTQDATIVIEYYLGRPYKATPSKIEIMQRQCTQFYATSLWLSPYQVLSQKTMFTVDKSMELVSKTIPEELESIATDKYVTPESKDVPPFFLGKPLILYFFNDHPLPYFNYVEKNVVFSKWSEMAFHEVYKLNNEAAKLKNGFGRYEFWLKTGAFYPSLPASHDSSIVVSLAGRYHPLVSKMDYFDETGNISTSTLNFKPKRNYLSFMMFPRYPILGGWNAHWQQSYVMPTSSVVTEIEGEDMFALEIPVYHAYGSIYTEEYHLNIQLPKGASAVNVSCAVPFVLNTEGFVWSLFDMFSPTPIINLKMHGLFLLEDEVLNTPVRVTFTFDKAYSYWWTLFSVSMAILIPLTIYFSLQLLNIRIASAGEKKQMDADRTFSKTAQNIIAQLEALYQLYVSTLDEAFANKPSIDAISKKWKSSSTEIKNEIFCIISKNSAFSGQLLQLNEYLTQLIAIMEKQINLELNNIAAKTKVSDKKKYTEQKATTEASLVNVEKQLWNFFATNLK